MPPTTATLAWLSPSVFSFAACTALHFRAPGHMHEHDMRPAGRPGRHLAGISDARCPLHSGGVPGSTAGSASACARVPRSIAWVPRPACLFGVHVVIGRSTGAGGVLVLLFFLKKKFSCCHSCHHQPLKSQECSTIGHFICPSDKCMLQISARSR